MKIQIEITAEELLTLNRGVKSQESNKEKKDSNGEELITSSGSIGVTEGENKQLKNVKSTPYHIINDNNKVIKKIKDEKLIVRKSCGFVMDYEPKLDITEQRILNYILSKSTQNGKNSTVLIDLNVFCALLGVSEGDRRHVLNACKKLRNRTIRITTSGQNVRLFDTVKVKGVNKVAMTLSSQFISQVVGTDNIEYPLKDMLQFKHKYSLWLFERLLVEKKNGSIGTIGIEVDDIKTKTGLQHLDNYKDLKRRVIDCFIEDVNRSSVLHVNKKIGIVKKGRRYHKVFFDFS